MNTNYCWYWTYFISILYFWLLHFLILHTRVLLILLFINNCIRTCIILFDSIYKIVITIWYTVYVYTVYTKYACYIYINYMCIILYIMCNGDIEHSKNIQRNSKLYCNEKRCHDNNDENYVFGQIYQPKITS